MGQDCVSNKEREKWIGDFSIAVVSTFLLPIDFCKHDNNRKQKHITKEDLDIVRDFIESDIVPRGATVQRKDCVHQFRDDEPHHRPMCRCFAIDDHFLKSPNIDNDFYRERYLLHTIKVNNPLLPHVKEVMLFLVMYYNLNRACLIINTRCKDENYFSPNECIAVRELLQNDEHAPKLEWSDFEELAMKPDKRATRITCEDELQQFECSYYTSNFILEEGNTPFPFKKFCTDYAEYLRRKFFHELYIIRKKCFPLRQVFIGPLIYNQFVVELKKIRKEDGLTLPPKEDSEERFMKRFQERYHRSMYGILVGDEGWCHVTKKLTDKRLKNAWGSRYFFKTYVYGNNILHLNFKDSTDYKSDQECTMKEIFKWQDSSWSRCKAKLGQKQRDKIDYFGIDSCIAGIDHTALHLACKAEVIYAEVKNSLAMTEHSLTSNDVMRTIDTLSAKRNDAFHSIMSSYIGTQELDDMAQIIYKQKGIDAAIKDLKYRAEMQQDKLLTLYQHQSNRRVYRLTVLTILTTVIIGLYAITLKDGFLFDGDKLIILDYIFLVVGVILIALLVFNLRDGKINHKS